jgi:predicted transcriptional regulator
MKLGRVREILDATVVAGGDDLDREIGMACGSDLMSDVLAFIKPEAMLLTGLTNAQVVRTAEMADLRAVCFVRGKTPQAEAVELANEKAIPLLSTEYPMFESCGRLYEEGLRGCTDRP